MTDTPKPSGIPEKIATAIVPAKMAAKLDASPKVSDYWRSALRLWSTYADLTTLSSMTTTGVLAYNAEKALGISLGLPLKLSIALGFVAVIVSFTVKFRKQNLPPPPPPPPDDTDQAGA